MLEEEGELGWLQGDPWELQVLVGASSVLLVA